MLDIEVAYAASKTIPVLLFAGFKKFLRYEVNYRMAIAYRMLWMHIHTALDAGSQHAIMGNWNHLKPALDFLYICFFNIFLFFIFSSPQIKLSEANGPLRII